MAILYYLHECSQAQVAGLLCLPVTTVNAALHAARKALERRMVHVVEKSLPEALSTRLAHDVGRVLAVDGPVVRARFAAVTVG